MEAFGIAIVLLMGLVGAPVFCLILVKVIRPFPALASLGFRMAAPIVVLFAGELSLVSAFGILGTRALVGPAFFFIHAVLALGIGPAIAGVALLGRRGLPRWWPLVAVVCWFAGACGVFYQYDVAETLYGIDGVGGPYQWPW